MNISEKLDLLSAGPELLKDLLKQIPDELLKIRRIKGKWSIHEHVCHLAEAQAMIMERFRIFKEVQNPEFKPYIPGSSETPDDHLLKMDFHESLEKFTVLRKELVSFLETFTNENWQNAGAHPEYKHFSPEMFLRHIIMHDHLHMYRIEELWLTNDEFLPH